MEADPVIIDAIAEGRYDGNLVDIAIAVRKRLTDGPTTSRWTLTCDGREFTEDDLTLGIARTIEAETGTNWLNLNPTKSATDCIAIVAGILHHRDGIPYEEADAQAAGWGVIATVQSISAYEVEV